MNSRYLRILATYEDLGHDEIVSFACSLLNRNRMHLIVRRQHTSHLYSYTFLL